MSQNKSKETVVLHDTTEKLRQFFRMTYYLEMHIVLSRFSFQYTTAQNLNTDKSADSKVQICN